MNANQTITPLNNFFDKVKQIGIMERIFGWKAFQALSFDAFSAYQALVKQVEEAQGRYDAIADQKLELTRKLDQYIQQNAKDIAEMSALKQNLENKQHLLTEKQGELAALKESQKLAREQLEKIHSEKALANSEHKVQSETISKLNQQIAEMEARIQSSQEKCFDLERDNAASVSNIETLRKTLSTKSDELSRSQQKGEALKEQVEALTLEKSDIKREIDALQVSLKSKEQAYGRANSKAEHGVQRIQELEQEKGNLQAELKLQTQRQEELKAQLTRFEESQNQKQRDYDHRVTQLNALNSQMEHDRLRIQAERESEIAEKHEAMKRQWRDHELWVEQTLKTLCQKHGIEYVNKVPFRGNPDNTLKIANEYIVFDAKAPLNDELNHFENYIKGQVDKLDKYAKHAEVRNELYLVVPRNAIDVIRETCHSTAKYKVFVVTVEAIEPILMSLLKIQEYEFVEQLSPEERSHISRTLGRFVHAAKRKIQIDSYMNTNFLELVRDCERLPEDMLQEAVHVEKSDKLNPPMEKRSKVISLQDSEKQLKRLKANAHGESIPTGDALKVIESIPLSGN